MRKYNSEEEPKLDVVENKTVRKPKAKKIKLTALVSVQFNGGDYLQTGQQVEVSEEEFQNKYARLEQKGYIKRD